MDEEMELILILYVHVRELRDVPFRFQNTLNYIMLLIHTHENDL